MLVFMETCELCSTSVSSLLILIPLQEVSEALAGQMSNQEEDEVEDELDALEKEVNGVQLPDAPNKTIITGPMPNVPATELESEESKLQRQKERAKARRVALEAS